MVGDGYAVIRRAPFIVFGRLAWFPSVRAGVVTCRTPFGDSEWLRVVAGLYVLRRWIGPVRFLT